mgnify:CR=1 FL=1
MGGIPKGLIHAAGITDLHIRILTEGVDPQVDRQRGAAPQAFGRGRCIAMSIKLFVLLPSGFQ